MLLVATLSYSFLPVMASTGEGTFALDLTGYSLNGNLENAIVNGNSVSMNMALNGVLQTSMGQIPITASGLWVGARNGSSLSGSIQEVFRDGLRVLPPLLVWHGYLRRTGGVGRYPNFHAGDRRLRRDDHIHKLRL